MQSAQRPLPLFPAPAASSQVIALRRPVRLAGAATPSPTRARPPLRLIVNRAADGSCRITASGRMADVCAELNRMQLA